MKHASRLLGVLIVALGPSWGSSQTTEEERIKAVLETQAAAWNRGDIEGFMGGYERSPMTTYVGSKTIRGYAAILESYRRRYPGPAGMGWVSFSNLDVRFVAPTAAIVIGRFDLDREEEDGGPASGVFSLVLRNGADGWKIVHDHSS